MHIEQPGCLAQRHGVLLATALQLGAEGFQFLLERCRGFEPGDAPLQGRAGACATVGGKGMQALEEAAFRFVDRA